MGSATAYRVQSQAPKFSPQATGPPCQRSEPQPRVFSHLQKGPSDVDLLPAEQPRLIQHGTQRSTKEAARVCRVNLL